MATFKYKMTQGSDRGKEITIDISAVDRQNESNLKKTADGSEVAFSAARSLVLIGGGHKPEVVAAAKDANCYVGKIKVTKGVWTGSNPGTLEVTGLSANRAEFEASIKRISKKKVLYK
jgi:hypothetical protein